MGVVRALVVYRSLIAGTAASGVVALCLATLLRRLDRREHGTIGRPAVVAALAFPVMLLAFGWGDKPGIPKSQSTPYEVALLTLVLAAAIWSVQRRSEQPVSADNRSSLRADASPSVVLLGVSAILVGVLWMIEVAVAGALHGQGTPPTTVGPKVFFATAAEAGVLAMAILQGIRDLLPVRGAFHRASVEQWVDESAREGVGIPIADTSAPAGAAPGSVAAGATQTTESKAGQPSSAPARNSLDIARILADIARLASAASGSERYAFFDLPIEQLCGQIAAGADRLLETPLAFESATAAQPKVGAAPSASQPPHAAPETAALLACLAGGWTGVERFLVLAPLIEAPENGSLLTEYMKIRAALSQAIQRNVDRLQIDTTFWWKRLLRGVSFIICAVIGRAVLQNAIAAGLCGIAGGFVASVSRDLVAIVEKVRR